MAKCRIQEKIQRVICQREAWSEDDEGLCILHSRQTSKSKSTFDDAIQSKLNVEDNNLSGVFFPWPYSFSQRQFDNRAIFDNAIFLEDVDFKEIKFKSGASFLETDFRGKVDFSGADFHGGEQLDCSAFSIGIGFSSVNFRKEAIFSQIKIIGHVFFNLNTIFHSSAEFYGTEVTGSLHFSTVTFNNWLNFRSAKFFKLLYFGRCSFKEEVIFDQAEFENLITFDSLENFIATFHSLQITPETTFIFEDLSLSKTQFVGTDPRKIEFKNVTWYPLRGRQAVYDEIIIRMNKIEAFDLLLKYGWASARRQMQQVRSEDYARVEELYRGLKQNYEKVGDYKRVGDFHYGEMEMHRLGNRRRRWISWYSFYWALSGYGERPLRALFILVGLILILPIIVWCLGTESYLNTLLFIIEKATLQRPAWPQGITWGGKLGSTLSVIFIPGQAALFLLALRNRLGRRR